MVMIPKHWTVYSFFKVYRIGMRVVWMYFLYSSLSHSCLSFSVVQWETAGFVWMVLAFCEISYFFRFLMVFGDRTGDLCKSFFSWSRFSIFRNSCLSLRGRFHMCFYLEYFSLFRDILSLRGCPRGVMVKAMDCGIVVHEFVLQSRYYVHFRANTLGKGMNTLILPAMG